MTRPRCPLDGRPRSTDVEEYVDSGLAARFLTNPIAVLLAVFVLLALIAARAGFGEVTGGGLSPVPESAGDWWRLHLESWHPLALGTDVPAPPYIAPLALLASLLGTTWTVSALLVLAVPLGLWGAWRFLRVVGRLVSPQGASRWLLLWGATTYALVPVAAGAWGDGRLGPVVSGAVLPWLAHAALGFADPDPDRRWRAAWRAGLLLAIVAAFTPVAWLFGLALGLTVLAAASRIVPGAMADSSIWGPPATAVGAVPVLLAPWWLPSIFNGAGKALVLDIGRLPTPSVDTLDLLAGRLGGLGAPWWAGIVLLVLALAALVPTATRIPVLVCWVVAAVAGVLAVLFGNLTISLTATDSQAGVAFLVVVLQACFVTAAVIAGQRLDFVPVGRWALGAVAAVVVIAAVVPLAGIGWWLSGADDALANDEDAGIPAYMVQRAETGSEHGILVVRGDVDEGLRYTVRRGDGVTLGEDEIIALAGEDSAFTDTVRSLTSRPTPEVVASLADRGIEYVVLPAPADGSVAAALDATGGLVQASAEDRSTRAWQVEPGTRSRRSARPAVLAADRPPRPPGTGPSRRAGAVPADAPGEAGGRMSTPTPGRRTAAAPEGRRTDVTVLLAVGLPLLVLLTALLVRPGDVDRSAVAPEETPLTRSTVICPSGDGDVVVANDTDATGRVAVRQGRREGTTQLTPRRPTRVESGKAPVVVAADGELAPGLLAGRSGSPLVAPDCRPPAFDEWFTGVGAGAKHSSVLELVNPDAGAAVVDVLAYGARGLIDAPVLRGLAVAGRSVVQIDLAQRLPRRDDLALHVRTTRGRVSAAVLDTYDELGTGRAATDYLPSQPAPATSNLLLGLPEGTGRRSLLLANPADTETRASIKVVTEKSTFAAVGSKDIVIAPQSVARVSISPLLRGRNARDALGLLVESSAPVTATARLFIGGDLAHLAPPQQLTETSLVVPQETQAAGARWCHERRGGAGRLARRSTVWSWRRTAWRWSPVAGECWTCRTARGWSRSPPTDRRSRESCWPPETVTRCSGCDPITRSGLVADVRPGLAYESSGPG